MTGRFVRSVVMPAVVAAAVAGAAPAAWAHGERSQEAFLRTRTLAWLDVGFSAGSVRVGEPLTVTGSFRVLSSWPELSVPPPDRAYLNVVAPGPVFVVKDRRVGGVFTPQTIELDVGRTYDFRLRLVARRAGRWHVHPGVSVRHAGLLVGPGREVVVSPGKTGFTNELRLRDGRRVDLETYGLAGVGLWHALALGLGLAWLLYWVIPNPLIERFGMVAARREAALVTAANKRMSILFAGLALALTAGGAVWAKLAWPVTIPPQVRLQHAVAAGEPARFVDARSPAQVRYDPAAHRLSFEVPVTNTGAEPARLTRMAVANLTFAEDGPSGRMEVSPAGPIGPGESRTLAVTIADPRWEHESLISLNEANARIGGALVFLDAAGRRNVVDLDAEIVPEAGHR